MDIQEAIRNLLLKVISSKADDALRYSEAILNLVNGVGLIHMMTVLRKNSGTSH